jgi:hypothetical protein
MNSNKRAPPTINIVPSKAEAIGDIFPSKKIVSVKTLGGG